SAARSIRPNALSRRLLRAGRADAGSLDDHAKLCRCLASLVRAAPELFDQLLVEPDRLLVRGQHRNARADVRQIAAEAEGAQTKQSALGGAEQLEGDVGQ